MLSALAETSLPFRSSIVSVMSLRTRPNDDALVISRVTPPVVIVQRYSACVCADTITLIAGSSRFAISAMSLPARLPAQPFSAAGPGLEAALVDDEDRHLHALVGERCDSAVRRVGLVLEREPGDAGRRDDRRRRLEHLADEADLERLWPSLSEVNCLIPYAGKSVCPVEFTITFADRYWKSAPG